MDEEEESWFDDDDEGDRRRSVCEAEEEEPMLRLPMRAKDADDSDEVEIGPRLTSHIRRHSTSSESDGEGSVESASELTAKKRIRTSLVDYEGGDDSDEEPSISDRKDEVPDAKRVALTQR